MPYFPYFLLSNPGTESFELYFLCMIDVDETGRFKPQQAIEVLQEIEKAVRAFCHSVAGNADERLGELFSALPVQATSRAGEGWYITSQRASNRSRWRSYFGLEKTKK